MELGDAIETYLQAVARIVRGDPEPLKGLYSEQDDIALANPWGPSRIGPAAVAEGLERAASQFLDGEPRQHDELARFLSGDLACLLMNERWQAKVSGRDEVTPFDLRVTTILRLEAGAWKVVHRHADPITTPNPAGPLIAG